MDLGIMNIDDLMVELTKIKEMYGNIPVMCRGDLFGFVNPVKDVSVVMTDGENSAILSCDYVNTEYKTLILKKEIGTVNRVCLDYEFL